MFYRLIAFLIMASCGALLTWTIANSLIAGQFDYSAFIAKVNANDEIRFFIENLDDFRFLLAVLWILLVMSFADALSKSSIDFTTYIGLGYLFTSAPVYALLLTYSYVTKTKMAFGEQLLLWIGIMNVLWLISRLIRRHYKDILFLYKNSPNTMQAAGNWTKLDRMDAKVIANVLGKEGVLRRMQDGTLCFGDTILNTSLVPSLQPGQSVELREVRKD